MFLWFGWYFDPSQTNIRPVASLKGEDDNFFVKFFNRNQSGKIANGDWLQVSIADFYGAPIDLFQKIHNQFIAWYVDEQEVMIRVIEKNHYFPKRSNQRDFVQVKFLINGVSSRFHLVDPTCIYNDYAYAVVRMYRYLRSIT